MSTVVIADPESPSRMALGAELHRVGHRVIAEVQDGHQALHKAIELAPDLLILPLRLRRLGGIEVIQQLRKRQVRTRVLVLSVGRTQHFAGVAMRAGASGFVSKREDMKQLLAAVDAITHGHTFFADDEGESLANDAWNRTEIEQLESLSPRELTVFGYLAGGYSNTAIARELGLSDRSVSTFKSRLFRKFNIKSLVELVGIAERLGVMGPPDDARSDISRQTNAPTLEQTLDAMPHSLAIRDLQGRLLFANEYYARHYGMRLREALGTRYSDLEHLDALTIKELETAFAEALQTGVTVNREVMVVNAGVHTAQAFWMAPIRDTHGKILAVVCGANPIDEYESMIVALRQELEQLRAANVARVNLLREYAESVKLEIDTLAKIVESDQVEANSKNVTNPAVAVARSCHMLRRHWEVLAEAVKLDDSVLRAASERCDPVAEVRQIFESIGAQRGIAMQIEHMREAGGPWQVWLPTKRFRDLLTRAVLFVLDKSSWRALDVAVSARDVSRGQVVLRVVVGQPDADPGRLVDDAFEFPQFVRSLAESIGAKIEIRRRGADSFLQIEVPLTRAGFADQVR